MYPSPISQSTSGSEEGLRDEIVTISRRQFDTARRLIQTTEWDYIQFMPTGMDLTQRHFWQYRDPNHPLYELGGPYESFVSDFYQVLDSELEQIFGLLSEDTAVMVVSTDGPTSRSEGDQKPTGFFILAGLVIHGAITAPTVIGGPILGYFFDFRRLGLLALSFLVSLLVGIVLFYAVDKLTPKIPFAQIEREPVAVGVHVFGYLVFFGLILHAALTTPL